MASGNTVRKPGPRPGPRLGALLGERAVSPESLFFLTVFLLPPPVLLAARFIWRRPAWWVIVLLIVLLGWPTYLITVMSHFEYLHDLVQSTDTPDPELLDQAYSDGAPLVFAALFGWAFALAYAVPWFVVFLAATGLRRVAGRVRRRRG